MKKVVIIGPESTGKSTLCKDLSAHFECSYLPEYAREYLEEYGSDYEYDDVLKMASGQAESEKVFEVRNKDFPFMFIDTNQYVYKVWIEEKYGKQESVVESLIQSSNYDHYFLCDIDIPWEYDEFREHPGEDDRKRLFGKFKDLLVADGTPFTVISGDRESRLAKALASLKKMI